MLSASALDGFVSKPRVADEVLGFQEEDYGDYGRAQEVCVPGVRWRRSFEGVIAFLLWMATPCAVEITGGQNFGEGKRAEPLQKQVGRVSEL